MLGRIVIGMFCLFVMTGVSFAQQSGVVNPIGLKWNANTESDLAGYIIYETTNPGVPGPEIARCTKEMTEFLFPPQMVHSDGNYGWQMSAYDEAGNESGLSNEATASFNVSAPAPPTGCVAIPPNP